jgi:hypothetical protein
MNVNGRIEEEEDDEEEEEMATTANSRWDNNKYFLGFFISRCLQYQNSSHNRLVNKIHDDLESKRYCSAAFIDISQAFDKVWHTDLYNILLGVPQGSIIGPILNSIYKADMPETEHTLTATYADDTAILTSHQNPSTASTNLQHNLNQFGTWLKQWRIKTNENKSTHLTFSLKKETCPAVTLNGQHIPQEETAKCRRSPHRPLADMAKKTYSLKENNLV